MEELVLSTLMGLTLCTVAILSAWHGYDKGRDKRRRNVIERFGSDDGLKNVHENYRKEINEIDSEIEYAEETRRLEREKADKLSYLQSIYEESEPTTVVYAVKRTRRMFGTTEEIIGVYATKHEAESVREKETHEGLETLIIVEIIEIPVYEPKEAE